MAIPVQPATLPSWTSGNLAARLPAPNGSEQESGFMQDFVPPASWHNWLFGWLCDWVIWLQAIAQPSSYGPPVITSAVAISLPQRDYLCNPSGGSFPASLPTAASAAGESFLVKNIAVGSANVVALTPYSGDSIEGDVAGAALNVAALDVRRLTSDGNTGWWLTNT